MPVGISAKSGRKKLYFAITYIIFVIGLAVLFNKYAGDKTQKQLLSALDDIAKQSVVTIQDNINNKLRELNYLAEQLSSQEGYDYTKSANDTKKFVKVLGLKRIGVALSDGIMYMNDGNILDINSREYFHHSMEGENYVSGILKDLKDEEEILVYSVPIYDKNNEIIGVLAASDNTKNFLQGFKVSILNGYGYSYVIDSKGEILSSSLYEKIDKTNLFEFLEEWPENKNAIQEFSRLLKDEKKGSIYVRAKEYQYATVSPLGIHDWSLVTLIPENILSERVATIQNVMKIIGVSITLGALILFILIVRIQRKYENYLKEIAYIDPFTGLHNKFYFQENFLSTIKDMQGKKAALVIYNIRRFKMVNEIYGEIAGDHLLKEIARILKEELILEKEMLMYGYADEFVTLYFYDEKEELEERIQNIFQKTGVIEYRDNRITLHMAVGIYEICNLQYSFEKVYNYANIAKKKSKNVLNEPFVYYSEQLKEKEVKQNKLNDSIKEGIKKKEFKAWFQPKFDPHTRELVGAEALARWYKEDGEILSPFYFVEFCEKVGLIQNIDLLIIEDVCKQFQTWREQGLPCLPISVNLSRAYLNSVDSIYHLKEILDQYKIESEYIQLEITESAIVDSEKELGNIIDTMHKLGFTVLLDDFGVGYSSLISINNLNFDILKIDKSFVDAIGTEKGDYIVKYTIGLGKKLGMDITVEGVETQEEYDFLKEQECDMIQGYYFCKPITGEDFAEMLKEVKR